MQTDCAAVGEGRTALRLRTNANTSTGYKYVVNLLWKTLKKVVYASCRIGKPQLAQARTSPSLNDHNRPSLIVTARLVISVRSNPITP
jgi:hypothetical protein